MVRERPTLRSPFVWTLPEGGPDAGLAREWLLTDGAGGFALGTALGANTRRYHGLLVAARQPPVDRVLVVHSVIDRVEGSAASDLAGHRFGPEALLHPDGWRGLVRFDAAPPTMSGWWYANAGWTVSRTVHLHPRAGAVTIRYRGAGLDASARLVARPLTPLRDFHALDREGDEAPCIVEHDGSTVRIRRGTTTARLEVRGGRWRIDPQWWRDFAYVEDRARGQAWREDVWSPGECIGEAASFEITVRLERGSARSRPSAAVPAASDPRSRLAVAADQFVVERSDAGASGRSVIAGYPWFADWGRDAMIALPGLMLATGRFDDARAVLETFARHRRAGLLPNAFDDRGHGAGYHAADAPLWFIHAVRLFIRATGAAAPRGLLVACREILDAYRSGTDFGIAVDADGLVRAGDGRHPLTWMDAQRDGVRFTPRDGKPVELSALWHNALRSLADVTDDAAEAPRLADEAERTARSFGASFAWPERGGLHDVLVPGPGGWIPSGGVRPNQILAVSLPFPPLGIDAGRSVLRVVRERLLTPYGLRTLDPADAAYRPRYDGSMHERDAAYHNGTVWPWLIGPYCDAVLRTGADGAEARHEARTAIEPLLRALDHDCVGQLAEVYDGDPPHRPSGCPAQAWSVAEVLRILVRLESD